MNRIIAALMALILIMTAISAAGCEAKEDPYKGYCTDGELAGGAALQNANAKSVTVSCAHKAGVLCGQPYERRQRGGGGLHGAGV